LTIEKKWEYNEGAHQLFIDFKKAYDSVRREFLYKSLTGLWTGLRWPRIGTGGGRL